MRGENLATVADFSVGEGFQAPFVLTWRESHLPTPQPVDPMVSLTSTEAYWNEWIGRCTYDGEWREAVVRSLLPGTSIRRSGRRLGGAGLTTPSTRS